MARSVVITGGTGGLGSAVTAALVAGGWDVVVPWVVATELDRVVAQPALTLIQADLMDPTAVASVVAAAPSPLRAVVNLVGGFAAPGRVHETPLGDFESQLRLNLYPGYLMCAAAIPRIIESGGGSVVLVSSQAVKRPFPGAAGYL